MKNTNYGIIDNEGGGDCLFSSIRDAFQGIDKPLSVARLRLILSQNATESKMNEYKQYYSMFKSSIENDTKTIKQLIEQQKELKDKYDKTSDSERDEKMKYAKQFKKLKSDIQMLKQDIHTSKEYLHEYRFMKGVETLEDFKEILRTCDFWGEMWTIATLEKALNVKLIILSSYHYKQRDYNNVLQCALGDSSITYPFRPKYYIMLEHIVNHYKLITYKGNTISTYKTLPYKIKKLIVEKCMERGDNLYNKIPKFRHLKDSLEKKLETEKEVGEKMEEKPVEKVEEMVEVVPKTEPELKEMSDVDLFEEKVEETGSGLYNDNVVFVMYKRSADKQPGKGSGEKIDKEEILKYNPLSSIPNWRKLIINGADNIEEYFSQNEEAKTALKLTRNAKLMKYVVRRPAVVLTELMEYRNKLNRETL